MSLRTTFEMKEESQGLIEALLLPEDGTRQDALNAWLHSTRPAILEKFSAFLDQLIVDCDNGLRDGGISIDKLRRYDFSMAFEFRFIRGVEKVTTVIPTVAVSAANNDDDGFVDSSHGRSSNDDRSDSLNPTSDAQHAAMDNHSNQMNPNNDAYWSSRGK